LGEKENRVQVRRNEEGKVERARRKKGRQEEKEKDGGDTIPSQAFEPCGWRSLLQVRASDSSTRLSCQVASCLSRVLHLSVWLLQSHPPSYRVYVLHLPQRSFSGDPSCPFSKYLIKDVVSERERVEVRVRGWWGGTLVKKPFLVVWVLA